MSSVFFFLFTVVLLLCYMKYLNGKMDYLAPIIFYWYYCCIYFYCYNTVNNNCQSNAVCSLKQHVFGPSRFLFVLYLVSLYLFIVYLHVGLCMHMYCLVCWLCVHTQHAHALLGLLAVCTHTTCTNTAWSVTCVYTHNIHMYCLVC